MDTRAFYRMVRERVNGLGIEESKRVTAVVLRALRDRLTRDEAEQVAAQLPGPLKEVWMARRSTRPPAPQDPPRRVPPARQARGGAPLRRRGAPPHRGGVCRAEDPALPGGSRRRHGAAPARSQDAVDGGVRHARSHTRSAPHGEEWVPCAGSRMRTSFPRWPESPARLPLVVANRIGPADARRVGCTLHAERCSDSAPESQGGRA